MSGPGLGYPQRLLRVIDRVPDPAATGDLELPLVQRDTVDLDATQIQPERVLARRILTASRIGGDRHPGPIEIVGNLRK